MRSSVERLPWKPGGIVPEFARLLKSRGWGSKIEPTLEAIHSRTDRIVGMERKESDTLLEILQHTASRSDGRWHLILRLSWTFRWIGAMDTSDDRGIQFSQGCPA